MLPCVARLREAGALILGKTNLDQFATGLVGVRTPYGIGRNLFDSEAHSRRIEHRLGAGGRRRHWRRSRSAPTPPARAACRPRFSNIVGLKPSRGVVSNAGVVPACRTLDCVSVFALTVDDAMATLAVIAGARCRPILIRARGRCDRVGPMPDGLRLGVPLPGQRLFFGDRAFERGL